MVYVSARLFFIFHYVVLFLVSFPRGHPRANLIHFNSTLLKKKSDNFPLLPIRVWSVIFFRAAFSSHH